MGGILFIVFMIFAYNKLKKAFTLTKGIVQFVIGILLIILFGKFFIRHFSKFFWTILILSILGFILTKKAEKEERQKIKEWKSRPLEEISLDQLDDKLLKAVAILEENDRNDRDYIFDPYSLPYGRINAFLNYFDKTINDEEVFYYSAVKSLDEEEIREYGSLVARTGIYISKQYRKKDGAYDVENIYIPFSGLYEARCNDKKIFYSTVNLSDEKLNLKNVEGNTTTIDKESMVNFLQTIIESKIPHAYSMATIIDKSFVEEELDNLEEDILRQEDLDKLSGIGATAGIMGSYGGMFDSYNENKNYMDGARGGGYAAEYGNNTVDRLLGRDVRNEAQNLDPNTGRQIKYGADRTVNGIQIQTKYCNNASDTIGSAFENGKSLYNYKGQMMQIEVPRDQYQESLRLMQKRIDSGQVRGAKPGDDPRKYVRKGHFTYAQANNIAISGTIESITVDLISGAVICSHAAGLSAVMVFAISVWQGNSIEDSAKAGVLTGLEVLGKGTLIYGLTMQLTRKNILNNTTINPVYKINEKIVTSLQKSNLAKIGLGKALNLENVTNKGVTTVGITTIVLFGPDVCRILQGKISGKQLFKNSAVGLSGLGGGIIGQSLIPIPYIGAMVGSTVAGFVAKQTLDCFIEDDAKLMFQILKEEFLDLVMISNLDKEEFGKVVSETIGHSKLPSMLRDMYASKEYRSFARNALVGVAISNVIAEREAIDDQDIYNGYKLLGEQLV